MVYSMPWGVIEVGYPSKRGLISHMPCTMPVTHRTMHIHVSRTVIALLYE